MPLGTSNRKYVRYIVESVFGTIPGSGNPNNLRVTSSELGFNPETTTSKEVRSDRQTSDLVLVGGSASGDVGFEMSYNEFDILLQAAFCDTWSVFGTNGVGAVIPTSATFAANTLTAGAATSGSSIFTNLKPGQWVGISGSTIPGQNIWAQVSRTVVPTATVLTFEGSPFTGVTGNGGTAVKLSTSELRNGTTQRTFVIEEGYTDINQYFAKRGCLLDKLTLSFNSGDILTGSFSFVGKDELRAGTTQLPGTPIASKTFDVMNAANGIGTIMEGGVALTGTYIKKLDLNFSNNARTRDGLGSLGAVDMALGTISVTASMDIYLADGTIYDKYLANQSSSLSIPFKDGSGNGYVLTLPKLKYSKSSRSGSQLDTDVMLSCEVTALVDPTTGVTAQLSRIGVAAT